jgi:hypothetical protein
MSLAFRNIVRPHHALVKYHDGLDRVEILCLASPYYRAAETSQAAGIPNSNAIYGFREYDADATLQGSFRDQFPESEGKLGHNPHPFMSPWNAALVDSNSIQLYASRSLDNGSSTTRIPTTLYRNGGVVEPLEVIVEWKIHNRVLTLVKGGELLIEIPISRLEDCIRDGRLAAQRIGGDENCVGRMRTMSA